MGCGRIQIASNKKAALLKQSMREVATMLMQDPPQEEKARIRAEALIRDDNLIEAYEILQLECELLHERIKLIEYSKTCPHDLVGVISTLIWASHRVDIPELVLIRKQFTAKYGKSFEENAMRNVDGVLNERVVTKLSVEPPAAYLVQTYLERICEIHKVDWTPSTKLTAGDAIQPMVGIFYKTLAVCLPILFQAPPTGYSIPVAQGTGLGPKETTPATTGFSNDAIPPAIPTAPSFPMSTTSRTNLDVETPTVFVPGSSVEDKEDDIYVPGASSKSLGEQPQHFPAANGHDERDDDNNTGNGDDGLGESYDDLAARFNKLNK